jgi:catechol 2,3-dioxygenase-like lactoylglutathione lyase family enzyme
MPRVVGIDHLVLSVGNFARSKEFYRKLLKFLDPPGECYDRNYYAVYFTYPEGMTLEGMIWGTPKKKRAPARRKNAYTSTKKKANRITRKS